MTTSLPANVTIVDLPAIGTSIASGTLFEAVTTVAGIQLSVKVPLSAMLATTFGGLPTGGATSNVLVKSSATTYAAAWGQVDLSTTAAVTGVLTVPNGGVGTAALTAHGVVLGNGTSSVNVAVPSTSGYALLSNGSSADPSFQIIPLASLTSIAPLSVLGVAGTATAVVAAIAASGGTQVLQTNAAGTGVFWGPLSTALLPGPFQVSSFTAFALIMGNGSAALSAIVPGTAGWPLVAQGTAASPAYTTLPVVGGGSGATSFTVFAPLLGNGTAAFTAVVIATAGFPLVSQGAATAPLYTTLTVPGGGIGTVTLTNFGVVVARGTSAFTAAAPATAGFPLVSQGTAALPVYTTLPVPGGGLGVVNITAFGLVMGAGTSPASTVQPDVATTILISNGTAAAPSFTTANLAGIVIKAGNQALTGGYSGTTIATGTVSTGTFTPNPQVSNFQSYLNAGAHTFAVPTLDCTMIVVCQNTTGAGAVTFPYTKRIGDTVGTAVGSTFLFMLSRTGNTSFLNVQAMT